MGPDGGGGIPGAIAAWVGWWIASAALWLFLVDNTHVPEMVVGAGVAILGASGALLVRQQRRVVLRPRPSWLLRAWRPFVAYGSDLWLLIRALPGRGGGGFAAVPVEPGTDDARGAARRVFMQAAGSFAPNTYAIGTDHERDLLLVHQLVPSEDPAGDADPLRLR